jgi:ferritin-like metal-binding protein YciE
MKTNNLDELFLDTLKDIYWAEKHILKALPKMAKGAHSDELRNAFTEHKDQTQGQIVRLEKVFELAGKKATAKKCDAMEGILKEGEEILGTFKDTDALDAGLISAAQAVEHYEIARYGTLHRWATMMGMDEAANLLRETLKEESQTDDLLTKLADSYANREAMA